MKAMIYRKAHPVAEFALAIEDLPEPTLRDSDVMVEIRAIGINPGEAFIRGQRSAERGGYVLLGWEFSGVIVGLGPKAVGRFEIGDRVFGTGDMTRDGAWADRLAVDHRIVAKIPEHLSFVDAASLPIGAITAWEAMFREGDSLPEGVDRVLILGGAGGVGSLATQLLKARTQAFVISTGSRAESRDWCTKMGADLVIDHGGDIVDQLARADITEVDMVFSTAKTSESIGWIAKVLRPFGHLSFVDAASQINIGALMSKSITLHAEMVFSRILYGRAPSLHGEILKTIARWADERRIRSIVATQLHGLSPAAMRRAHEVLETGRTIGKIVILF